MEASQAWARQRCWTTWPRRPQAAGIARAAGVQLEMELAFAALHQLCAPMLDRLDHLPAPQRDALRTAFGVSAGLAPERFMVGLAVLSLLSDVAEDQPLICLVDDEQWLDRASAQILGFVARRLAAESVALVFAARVPGGELAGLPELAVEGLREAEARALLGSAVIGPLDPRVRDQIVTETRGNPLALLELPRGLTPAELAGGSAAQCDTGRGAGRGGIPQASQRSPYPGPAAAPDRSGRSDRRPGLVWRAAARLAVSAKAATLTAEAGLLDLGTRVQFRHPLVRRPTGQRRCRSARTRTERWRTSPIRGPIRTAGPGTGRRPPPVPTRRSPGSLSARPAGRRRAGAWPPRPRSWNARQC